MNSLKNKIAYYNQLIQHDKQCIQHGWHQVKVKLYSYIVPSTIALGLYGIISRLKPKRRTTKPPFKSFLRQIMVEQLLIITINSLFRKRLNRR